MENKLINDAALFMLKESGKESGSLIETDKFVIHITKKKSDDDIEYSDFCKAYIEEDLARILFNSFNSSKFSESEKVRHILQMPIMGALYFLSRKVNNASELSDLAAVYATIADIEDCMEYMKSFMPKINKSNKPTKEE